MYVIQHENGRVTETPYSGEARMWAWMAMAFDICRVYQASPIGVLAPVSPFKFIRS